jgi:hypothetical protein
MELTEQIRKTLHVESEGNRMKAESVFFDEFKD